MDDYYAEVDIFRFYETETSQTCIFIIKIIIGKYEWKSATWKGSSQCKNYVTWKNLNYLKNLIKTHCAKGKCFIRSFMLIIF